VSELQGSRATDAPDLEVRRHNNIESELSAFHAARIVGASKAVYSFVVAIGGMKAGGGDSRCSCTGLVVG